jgi:hypothetical protein
MTNITIDVVFAMISDDYEPTNTELLILRDIVRDHKFPRNRSTSKGFDSTLIMELFDYKIHLDPIRLTKLDDKKRLLIKHNKSIKPYKQRF